MYNISRMIGQYFVIIVHPVGILRRSSTACSELFRHSRCLNIFVELFIVVIKSKYSRNNINVLVVCLRSLVVS